MNRILYIREKENGITEIAVTEDGKLCEYLKDIPENEAHDAAVWKGKVVRVIKGMGAAFVDIGQEKNGFLPLEEDSQSFQGKPVRQGDSVVVQIKREAQGTKGAFLSRDISLTGTYLILMPMNRHIGISSKIHSTDVKDRLKSLANECFSHDVGIIFRTSCSNIDNEILVEEYSDLYRRWEEIKKNIPTAHEPSLLSSSIGLLSRLQADYLPRQGIDRIFDDASEETWSRLEHDRERAMNRKVWLKSGGNLIIDQCEALTVIDINTAKYTGETMQERTLLKTNLEACEEIARQVRLRNLSGMILLDMIDMDCEDNRELILEALRKAFENDRIKTVIHGFTSLGLIEMTRKRSRKTLRDDWEKPCPYCNSTGWLSKSNSLPLIDRMEETND